MVTPAQLAALRRTPAPGGGPALSRLTSWAVWESARPPGQCFGDDSRRLHLPAVDDELCAVLRPDVVLLGLCPGPVARAADWALGHDGAGTWAAPERLAEACRTTGLWGALLVDLFALVDDANAATVLRRVRGLQEVPRGQEARYDRATSVASMELVLDVVGAPDDVLVVALGGQTTQWARKLLVDVADPAVTAVRRCRYRVVGVDHHGDANGKLRRHAGAGAKARGYARLVLDRLRLSGIDAYEPSRLSDCG